MCTLNAVSAPNATAIDRCFIANGDTDCPSGLCTPAGAMSWCQCQQNGTVSCKVMGTCAAAANCANCGACVAAVADFVKSQLTVADATAVGAAFVTALPSIQQKIGAAAATLSPDSAAAQAVRTAIQGSYQGSLAKRAGALCTQMQCELLSALL